MGNAIRKETVNGGVIHRNAKTGRFVSVTTKEGTSRSSAHSVDSIQTIISKRKEALKRLSDR